MNCPAGAREAGLSHDLGAPLCKGFALRGELLCPWRQRNQNATGDGSDEHFVLIVAHPTPSGPSGHLPLTGGVGPGPHYGGRPPERLFFISGAQNLRGFPRFLPGHWALTFPELQLVRFHSRAWLCRAGGGWCWAVGRGLLDAPRTSEGRSGTGPYVKNRRFLDTP